MILGVGIDLIEVCRIERTVEKFGERFLQRILLPAEIEYCRRHAKPGPHIAARFAAKEAIAKAFGTGIGGELSWRSMEIAHHPTGEPYVILHGQGHHLFAQRKAHSLRVSLSHTAAYATAIAILQSPP
jgi:holo-[acyl-carrier protein] synthase